MKKQILLLMALGLGIIRPLLGQTDQENLDKYWMYRDRLVKNFLKVGKEAGESLPMAARRIGFTTSNETFDGEHESSFYWQDCNIYLGHYMAVLATEYKLLTNAGQDATQTINEIYYCLATLNRLDLSAEWYLSQQLIAESPDNLNGYLLRDDVSKDFGLNMMEFCSTDHSMIFGVDANFNRMHGDYYRVGPVENVETNYNKGNCPSLDQFLGIMLGLVYIDEMVGSILVQPTSEDVAMNINMEVEAITLRLIDYLNANRWRFKRVVGSEDCGGLNDGYVCNGGSNARIFAYPIIEMAKRILEQQNLVCNSSLLPCDKVDLFLEHSTNDLCRIVDRLENVPAPLQTWLNGHACQTEEDSEDNWFQTSMANLGWKKFWKGMELLNIPYSSNIGDILEALLDSPEALVLDIDFCIRHPSELIFDVNDLDLDIIWETTCDQVRLTMDLSDLDFMVKPFDDDNVHMILDAAVCGNIWGSQYVADMANTSNAFHVALADHVLNGYSISTSLSPVRILSESYSLFEQLYGNLPPHLGSKEYFKQVFISSAPIGGCYADPNLLENNSGPVWASINKLFHFNNMANGPVTDSNVPESSMRGEFSGLDFMLYYNLYHLVWEEDLPEYKRECKCSEYQQEITTLSDLNETLLIKRKFPDYKAKHIPIPSFLYHDLNVNEITGVLNVKNDFIICSPDQATPTTLHLTNNAKMNIYDGNTITVREGNKIKLSSGASIVAGMTDTDYEGEYPIPTIELLPGAELIIESGARLHTKKGLLINLHEGSKLTIDGGQCKPEQLTDVGITIINHGGTIEVINGGILRTRNNQEMVHSMINATVLLDDGQWICENPTNIHSWFLQDCVVLANHNSVIEMNGHLALYQSTLTFNHLSDLKINEGSIHVLEGSRLFWGGELVELKGHNASILFDRGQMEIGANKTFAPWHASMPSGFIEFKGYNDYSSGSYDLYMNQGSVMLLVGDGMEDLMLKVDEFDLQTKYLGPNADDITADNGSLVFSNCKVELCKGGDITTDFSLDAHRVLFSRPADIPVDGESILYMWWEPHFDLRSCRFERVYIESQGAPLSALETDFNNSNVNLRFAHYKLSNCEFENTNFGSMEALNFCEIYNCNFSNGSDVWDKSLVELRVDNSRFDASPLSKHYGVLSLACNRFANESEAVEVGSAFLNMSGASAAGYNKFENVSTCLKLSVSSGLDLWEGYNNLSGYTQFCIKGSLDWPCDEEDCWRYLKTSNNYWGSSGDFNPFEPSNFLTPDNGYVQIELYALDDFSNCNINNPNGQGSGCDVLVTDAEPSYTDDCGRGKITVRKTEKSMKAPMHGPVSAVQQYQLRDLSEDLGNPILTGTEHFAGYTLDSALVAAASLMELYDSLGNDASAIALFEEILTSGLDRSHPDVRWRMEWGRKQMKSAVESMFVDDELSVLANEVSFETPVLQYVHVLNTMTDTVLTDSTYKDQFYVELDKGQLFRTIGQPLVAKYIFEHLGDCQLDSLEQARLNEWQQTVDFELALRSAYFNDSLLTDTIAVFVDTTLYPIPYNVDLSNYYFGVWIGGPQDVAFVNCGEDLEFRTFMEQTDDWNIYPNPAHDRISLSCPTDERAVITIYDSMGRMAYQEVINFGDQHTATIQLGQQWPAGNYVLCKETNGMAAFKQFVVVR